MFLHNQRQYHLLPILLFDPDPVHISAALRQTVQSKLTSVSIEGSKGDPLFCWAGAVGDLHLQFIPGCLLQVVQDVALGQRRALGCGPGGWLHCSVLQDEGGDWTAAVVPANQVEPGPCRVDAGEEFMFFGKLGFWGEEMQNSKARTSGKWHRHDHVTIQDHSLVQTFKVDQHDDYNMWNTT